MPIPFYHPTPAPAGVFMGRPFPFQNAGVLQKFSFNWIGALMKVAYSKPIEPDDLYETTSVIACRTLGDQVEAQFMRRMPPSRRPPHYIHSHTSLHVSDIAPNLSPLSTSHSGSESTPLLYSSYLASASDDYEHNVKAFGNKKAKMLQQDQLAIEDGKEYDMSLWKAMLLTVWSQLLFDFVVRAISQIMRTLAPMVSNLLMAQLALSYEWHKHVRQDLPTDGLDPPSSTQYMFCLVVALWVMIFASSFANHYTAFHPALVGRNLRTAMMTIISRKAMRLSSKARLTMTQGRLTTMLSADCGYLESAFQATPHLPVAVIMLSLGMALLFSLLGYSALVGIAVLILDGPLKVWTYKQISKLCQDQSRLVDVRIRLLSEVLNNMRAIKFHAYESCFGQRISDMRKQELELLSQNNLRSSGITATSQFVPAFAATLTFITYHLTGHSLNAATVFASLQYYAVLKSPISQLPELVNVFITARVGVGRIETLLKAEEMQVCLNIKPDSPYGIDVKGDFHYEAEHQPEEEDKADKSKTGKSSRPFALRGVDLKIPKGALVCVVGRVGTGKTSLLLGLIKDMKQMAGHVTFGGTVSYVPQKAWVQSGTVKDNITFSSDSHEVDPAKIEQMVDACALRTDIDMWRDGILTRVGERGITLSGGQRQRICIARAAYCESQVVLLDDPLSAVDAHVGHHLLENCILNGPMSNRTRVLVTHQLDVLPKADYILVIDRDDNGDGRIVQQGTFQDLAKTKGIFQNLYHQFGSSQTSQAMSMSSHSSNLHLSPPEGEANEVVKSAKTSGKPVAKLFLDEEMAQGTVKWSVYLKYAQAVGSWTLLSTCAVVLVLTHIAIVFNTLFLGYWTENRFEGMSQASYMWIYAGLALAIALFNVQWASIHSIFIAGRNASFTMFNQAWSKVMRSPLFWHDQTPTGRIISRMSKDVELLDEKVASIWYYVFYCVLSILSAIGLMLYTYPWLALLMIPLVFFSCLCTLYYRRTSKDLGRLSSVLRSEVFTTFGEQLAGSSVIRTFGRQEQFHRHLEYAVDLENMAYLCGTFSQEKWLGVRLSVSTYLPVLFLGIFGVIERNKVSPTMFGVVLTHLIGSVFLMGNLVHLGTEAEKQMNTVERLQYYMSLETEAASVLPSDPKPDQSWPTKGEIVFRDVEMRYRPDLPLVLKRLNFVINPGKKIEVDGLDLKRIGLETLRQRLTVIPQDAFLFAGTIRDNMDPTGLRTDAELNDILNLVHHNHKASESLKEKFHLDEVVTDEGANFSAGEQQLLGLLRALAKGCKVLLLDEATSSVDPETDALIQCIIQTAFSDITLISIAHRLQTVAYYDQILVIEAGQLIEFDSPLALFDKVDSTFRELCNKKGLSREDLTKIRMDASAAPATSHFL
ncbi:hypothetical protein IAR55_003423 [Kwoniella newhampshirensis]|uniref:P-loop containing nucleoside triphosphate hydrolase protein n=1 Tax=Kwoniella newhampshirensis TaxID=1651941 RepID=A0AAW0YZF6_9TREE